MALAYAQALSDNRLDDAFALLPAEEQQRVGLEAFRERYLLETRRLDRAAQIVSALKGPLRARVGPVAVVQASEEWRIWEPEPTEAPREILVRFLAAVEAKDFTTVHSLLSSRWKTAYSVERLAADFALEPTVRDRLAKLRDAQSAAFTFQGDLVLLPLDDNKAFRLEREVDPQLGPVFKVAALE